MTDDNTARKLMDRGIALFKQQDYHRACQSLLDLVAKFPESDLADNAYYNLGQIYLKLDNFSKAYVCFKTILETYPDSDAAQFAGDYLDEVKNQADPCSDLYEEAQAAYIGGKLQKSFDLYTKLVTQNPESELADNAYFSLGMLEWKRGNKETAAGYFKTVREKYPESDAARLLKERDA